VSDRTSRRKYLLLQQTKVDELVSKLVQIEGSDLHLKAGAPPVVRVHGELEYLEGYEVLRPVDTDDILKEIIPEKLVGVSRRMGRRTSPMRSPGWAGSG
jgi:Tfp pilus assembly pilus retraction ATPase PilT